MAPLRTKLNQTLHKINGKFKRQSVRPANSFDNNDDVLGDQSRTLLGHTTLSKDISLSALLPGTSTMANDEAYLNSIDLSGQSAWSVSMHPPGDGSHADPIDLTGGMNSNIVVATEASSRKLHNIVDLTSPTSTKSPHGQKRGSDLDYAAGQKTKMYRPAPNHHSSADTTAVYLCDPMSPGTFERHSGNDDPIVGAWRDSTRHLTEDHAAAFAEKILATACKICRLPFFAGGVEDIVTRTKDMLGPKGTLHPYHTCAKCRTVACAACGAGRPRGTSRQPWCCNDGRLFLIWSLCCGTDFKRPEGTSGSPTLQRLLKRQSKGAPSPAKGKEPPPARALSKGVGYGGDDFGRIAPVDALLASVKVTPREKLVASYFTALKTLFASFIPEAAPPAMLKFMLHRSPLLLKAVELLRIDSIEVMTARTEIYEPLLGFIGTISRHPSTWSVVYGDHIMYPLEEQLGHFSSGTGIGGRPNLRTKKPDQGSSIAKIVENLAMQCRHLNRLASARMEELNAGESGRMLALSRAITDLAAEFASIASVDLDLSASPSNVHTRSREAEKTRDELKDLHRNDCVAERSDDELLQNFYYKNDVARVTAATAAKGRMKKLVSQIANLRTSLPEGIWIRHGSSRLDVIKVLMVGPRGTPYEHGLFEFDLFCPANFPNGPPSMQFRTNGGGKVRFNPNLYEDGKVCLSILGTWSGEAWNAGYSTLLQVLVSIHGMILVDQPWYNEPGRERRQDKAASKNYNSQIQVYTVQYAMTEWLTTRLAAGGAQDDPVWGNIIRKHFQANGKTIVETAAKKWKVPKEVLGNLQDAISRHGF